MTRKTILIIGPIYPYRGGISHYTGLLAQSLSSRFDVKVFSFKMQYPKFLYKNEQKNYDSTIFAYDDTEYIINTLNPFNWAITARKIKRLKPDMIIVQWWHPYFAPAWHGILRRVSKNIPTVFTCHNVYPHESKIPFVEQMTRYTLRLGNRFIVHADSEATDLRSLLPEAEYRQTVHPTYNSFRIEGISKREARARLDIDQNAQVLLFFGFIRKYKGLKYLLNAMPSIVQKHSNALLLVVGEFFDNDKEDYVRLINELDCAGNIRLVDGYLPDRDVEPYFAACDIVILPYTSATQSGIVQIAYGFEKPVITTRVGGLPDVVIDGETGILIDPENPEEIARAVKKYYDENEKDAFAVKIKELNEVYSWDKMVTVIESLYDDIREQEEGNKEHC